MPAKCFNESTGKFLAFLSPSGSESWRAYRFMWFRKCFGYAVYPALALAFAFPQLSRAQQSLTPSSSQDQMQQYQPPQATQQRALVLQEAQRRLDARRRQRIHQLDIQTYNHKYELFFGGGYLRFRPGQYLQHNQQVAWNLGLTDYLKGDLGITGEVRGYYGSAYTNAHPSGVNRDYQPNITEYAYMAGPTYRFYHGQHWGWTAQVLGGAAQGRFGIDTNGLPPQYVGLYKDQWAPVINVGASVDYNLSPGLALRLTPDMVITHFGSQMQYNKGWQIDLVYRFKHRRNYTFGGHRK